MLNKKANAAAVALIAVVVLVIVAVVVFSWYVRGYNKAVNLEQAAQQKWSDVDAQLQRRIELIPNLVNTVKGYATHERELFTDIAKSREKYFQADTRGEKIEASNQMAGLLNRLLFLQERYPELKANENFLSLQIALEGTENRIAVARRDYNQAAKALNTYARSFFGSFFVTRAGVEPVEYFEATEEARNTVPDVNF